MAIRRTVKTTAKVAQTPVTKAAKPRQRMEAAATVPKVAARVVKDEEIRLVRKVDHVVTDASHTERSIAAWKSRALTAYRR